jgi:cyclic beta-1,2-glucan synthetase
MEYAASRGVPWGISESAYNARDLEGNYQYKAFGVPGLGLKRGLGDDLVIAPYASMLAASLRPREVIDNLDALDAEGLWSGYGYYDAVDYTGARLHPGTRGAVVATVMAHHQGMTLVALDNCLNAQVMPRRFHRDQRIRAVELLLHERIPALVPLTPPPAEQTGDIRTPRTSLAPVGRRYTTPHTAGPRTHLLSNGTYNVMVTNAGGGYSTCRGLALTRWREDRTSDNWGQFCFVRDLRTGTVWSTTYQPTLVEPDDYHVAFGPDRATFRRRDGTIDVHTEIAVSPEDDVELRRVSVINRGIAVREIELTSYAEIVLAAEGGDIAHPAFSNLFVETTLLPDRDAILCTRRPRADEPRRYLVHVLASRGRVGGGAEFETDRARFLGRLGQITLPQALRLRQPLSGTSGAVLDPIVSLRQRVRLPPGATARLSFVTGYADSEDQALALVEKYHDRQAVARGLALAGGHSQAEMRHLNLDDRQANAIQRLASRLRFSDPRLRQPEAIARNRQSRDALWRHGISGDLPILLVVIDQEGDHGVVREALKAHEYCRLKGFAFDLVLLNEFGNGYRQEVQDQIAALIEASPSASWRDTPAGVFLRRSDALSPDDAITLRAMARTVLVTSSGSMTHQLEMPGSPAALASATEGTAPAPWNAAAPAAGADGPRLPATTLLANDVGGFAPDARQYVMAVGGDRQTPAPWSNVLANPTFGCLVTEAGPRCTWADNSQSRRLTTWANDPVTDPATEAIFLHDRVTDRAWSLTPSPRPSGARYLVEHGQGRTTWEHATDEWHSVLSVSVPADAPVKLLHLRLHNASRSSRTATLTWYAELTLGDHRSHTASTIVTRLDVETGMLVADNVMSEHFGGGVLFMDTSERQRAVTGDRTAFIGRNRTLATARGISGVAGGRVGAALDPCGVVQVAVSLGAGETRQVSFVLGHAADVDAARELAARFRDPVAAQAADDRAVAIWDERLSRVQIRTPDAALDVLVNRWLLYQTLACRVWGRTAFYQSSGAFGFRDQLQDVLALLWVDPRLAHAQLLHAASRQFVEGDVQHWWHEPGGHGVRTRFSDDRLWMVYVAMQYIDVTGDHTVLEHVVPFLAGRRLDPHEHEVYQPAHPSDEQGTLFEHCARAIDISLDSGAHGLPLMGTGDWNDGMNRVGEGGLGESVWLAWFQLAILPRFAALAEARGDLERARRYRNRVMTLETAAEAAWDGAWYRRAYFDDGTPLGSTTNPECRIDAIAQAWAVLSGHGDPQRAATAMASVDRLLVRRDSGLVLLLTPPFNRMVPSPGYIKGYVPGVRENGGQYTHAALWVVLAFAQLGDGAKAAELLSMLNPARRTSTTEDLSRYRAEPYVVAADVYSQAPHTGRGGWTWYTGSASWMYRVALEGLLGVTLQGGDTLHVNPCIPPTWPGFEVTLRRPGATEYVVVVENPHGASTGVARVEVDGLALDVTAVKLVGDGRRHQVRVVMGQPVPPAQNPAQPGPLRPNPVNLRG